VAKFRGDRPRDLGDWALNKKKHHGQNISPSGTVVPGGLKRKEKENWKSKVQDKSSYKNYKKEIKDLKLRSLTGRSQRQVPIFQWQGMGPARTGRGAAPGQKLSWTIVIVICTFH